MTDSHKHAPPARRIRWGAAAAAGLTLVGGAAVLAQQAGWPGSARLVDDLRACRGVAAVDARAACYD
ncbi:MAG: hypothetical protein ACOVKV_18405, partial [Novosphingobium sp.]